MPAKYSPQELEKLLLGFNLGASLSELEAKLGRPTRGIIEKMQALSRQYPDTWSPGRVGEYRRVWYHERGGREYHNQRRLRQEFPDLKTILNLGYAMGIVQLTDGQLRLHINEPPEKMCMEDAVDDFRGAVGQYGVVLNFDYEGTTLVLSPDGRGRRYRTRSMRFLEALKYAFENNYHR